MIRNPVVTANIVVYARRELNQREFDAFYEKANEILDRVNFKQIIQSKMTDEEIEQMWFDVEAT